MKNFLLITVLAFSSFANAQEMKDQLRIEISVKLNQVYNQTSEDVFKSDKATGSTNLKITGSTKTGEVVNYDSGDIANEQISLSDLRIVDSKTIELTDVLKGTSKLVKAEVSAEAIKVSSAEVGSLLAADLKKQGQDLVSSLRLETADGKLDYQMDVSDMNCARAAKALSCDLSAKLVLDVVGK